MGASWGLALRDAARKLAARRRHEEGEEAAEEAGFTLIELMVVLLIMGILMAIAIPTFLGAAGGAHDKASQSDLTNAMTSAKTIYASNGQYTSSTTGGLKSLLTNAEPEMHFASDGASAKATTLSFDIVSSTVLVLASDATTGNCWFAIDNETVTTHTGAPSGVSYGVKALSSATCKATAHPTAAATWHRAWPKAANGK